MQVERPAAIPFTPAERRVAPSVMVEELMRDFAVGAGVLGNLSAAYFYGYAGMQIPVGVLLDRFGPRRLIAISTLLCADGCVLLRQRPEKGLLGAMTEVPGSEWAHDFDIAGALDAAPRLRAKAKWRRVPGVVTHVFTHFPLELAVFAAQVPRAAKTPKGARWVKVTDLAGEALPSVMRKVLAHAFELK